MFTMPELRVGAPVRHDRLTVFPLFTDRPPAPDYRLSDEALADGTAVVEEISEGGSVPTLSVRNQSDTGVLFLEGEELRGAKQNRVLNTTVLVPARTNTAIPVSCVERGRWRYASKSFSHGGSHSSSKLRSVLKASVTNSAVTGRGHGSDQGAVWAEVDRQMASLGSESMTAAMSDTFTAHADKVATFQERIEYVEGACGLAVAVGPDVVAVDVFDSPATCKKVWTRLLTGVAMDALEAGKGGTAGDAAVDRALSAFRLGPWSAVPAAGAGEEFRTTGGRWQGSALSVHGRLVHGSLILAG